MSIISLGVSSIVLFEFFYFFASLPWRKCIFEMVWFFFFFYDFEWVSGLNLPRLLVGFDVNVEVSEFMVDNFRKKWKKGMTRFQSHLARKWQNTKMEYVIWGYFAIGLTGRKRAL